MELVFCPYCGRTQDDLIIQYNHKEEWVQCECGACGPPKPISINGNDCRIAWNMRTKKTVPTSCALCDNGIICENEDNYMRMPTSKWCSCPLGIKKYAEFITQEVKNG